ncbi:unnamed protein product, partial [Cylindrotheca closterium]
MGDQEIFAEDGGLREKVPKGKVVICDRVYTDKKTAGNNAKLALPSLADPGPLFKFKSK